MSAQGRFFRWGNKTIGVITSLFPGKQKRRRERGAGGEGRERETETNAIEVSLVIALPL